MVKNVVGMPKMSIKLTRQNSNINIIHINFATEEVRECEH